MLFIEIINDMWYICKMSFIVRKQYFGLLIQNGNFHRGGTDVDAQSSSVAFVIHKPDSFPLISGPFSEKRPEKSKRICHLLYYFP